MISESDLRTVQPGQTIKIHSIRFEARLVFSPIKAEVISCSVKDSYLFISLLESTKEAVYKGECLFKGERYSIDHEDIFSLTDVIRLK